MSAAAASAATPNVTMDDINQYLAQSVDAYREACSKGFGEHNYEPVTAGLKIGNHIMTNLVNKSVNATRPGQVTVMDNADLFTMVSVLAKTNVAVLTSLDRAQYHEKLSRTLTAEVNKMRGTLTETEEKVNNQANAEEVINRMAEVMKGSGKGAGFGGPAHKIWSFNHQIRWFRRSCGYTCF